jgi:hypothetical protein
LAAVLGLALLGSGVALAEAGIVVVARKDSPLAELSREEVAALFLGKRKLSNDVAVTPIDSKDSALRERFYLAVADMNGLRVKAYWSRIVFSGQGRPPREAALAETGALLSGEPGTLTYLPADQVTPDMKIVFSVP